MYCIFNILVLHHSISHSQVLSQVLPKPLQNPCKTCEDADPACALQNLCSGLTTSDMCKTGDKTCGRSQLVLHPGQQNPRAQKHLQNSHLPCKSRAHILEVSCAHTAKPAATRIAATLQLLSLPVQVLHQASSSGHHLPLPALLPVYFLAAFAALQQILQTSYNISRLAFLL